MDYYENNLAALRKIDPQVAEWLEIEPDVDWLAPVTPQGGADNFLFRHGKEKKFAYDPHNPLNGIALETKGQNLGKRNSTLLIGIGLGYLVQKVMDRMESGHVVIVVEHTAQLARLTLKRYDFSRALTSGALILACGKQEWIMDRISKLNISKFTQSAGISIITEGYAELLTEKYGSLKQDVLGRIHTIRGMVGANSLFGFQADLNEVMSCPRLIQSKGVGELEGLFSGYPAILVSTGPSLGRNIHHLKKAQGSALIIAAGQALRALLAYGIRPDLITYIDYMDHAVDHLAGLMSCRDVPLVCVPKVCHPLIRQWQGPVLVAGPDDKNAMGCLNDLWAQKGEIRPGISVAHFNLTLAQHLKADPIIFVGQDFAVGGEFTHFDQVDHRHRIGSTANNKIVTRMDDLKAVNKDLEINRGEVYTLPGYFGEKVTTYNNLLAQLDQFQGIIEAGEGTFVNCTEGGARIARTLQMRLTQALETYCRTPIPCDLLQTLHQKDDSDRGEIKRILPLLRGELVGLRRIRKKALAAMEVSRELADFLDNFSARPVDLGMAESLVQKNKKSAKELRSYLKKTPYLHQALFWSHGEIEKEMEQKHAGGEAKTRVLVQADHEFAATALEKAGIMAEAYAGAMETLENYLEDQKAAALAPESPLYLFNLAETCLEMGEVREGLELLTQATGLAPHELDYWSELARRSLEAEQYSLVGQALENLAALPEISTKKNQLTANYKEKLEYILNAAESDIKTGFLARALVDLRKYLEAEPDSPKALELVRYCQDGLAQKTGKAAREAEQEWIRFEEASQNKEYFDLLAQASRLDASRKDSPEALALFNSAVELDPGRLEARWGLATTLCLMGRYDQAVPVYEGLVSDFPDNPHLRLELGWLKVRQGRAGDGLELVVPLEERIEEHPKLRPALGDLHLLARHYETALGYYDKHLKTATRDYMIWTKRGDCLFRLGRPESAAESYRRALSLKPGYSGAMGGLNRLNAMNRESLGLELLGGPQG